jgi:hypothetical protein
MFGQSNPCWQTTNGEPSLYQAIATVCRVFGASEARYVDGLAAGGLPLHFATPSSDKDSSFPSLQDNFAGLQEDFERDF